MAVCVWMVKAYRTNQGTLSIYCLYSVKGLSSSVKQCQHSVSKVSRQHRTMAGLFQDSVRIISEVCAEGGVRTGQWGIWETMDKDPDPCHHSIIT